MNSIIYYLQVQILFSVLFGLWWLCFRKNTFHVANRLILLGILVTSLSGPWVSQLFPIATSFSTETLSHVGNSDPTENVMGLFDGNEAPLLSFSFTPASSRPITQYLIVLALAIAILKLLLLGHQLVRQWVRAAQYPQQPSDGVHVCFTDGQEGPSSFFRYLLLPSTPVPQGVYSHELCHAQQGHSWDLLFTELWVAFSWLNPLAYLFRNSIKHVHEYLADEASLQQISKQEYFKLIWKETTKHNQVKSPLLAPSFFHATIKNRIHMMKKNPTTTSKRLGYAVLLPALAMLVWAFRPSNTVPSALGIPTWDMHTAIPRPPEGSPIKAADLRRLSSGFGMRMHPIFKVKKMHNGLDFTAIAGAPVLATGTGKVIAAGEIEGHEGYGLAVIIQHDEEYRTQYHHLDRVLVKEGDVINTGDQLGIVGNTGASTAPHLHYEVRKNGTPVNPFDYLPLNEMGLKNR